MGGTLTCDQAFFFFAAEGGRKKKESLIQLLVESSAAPQLKCLSTRVSAMPSDKSEPITIYRKSLRWRESAEARSGHEVCKQLYVAFCFPTNQKKVQILDFLQTTRQVIVSGVHFSVDYTAARKITPDRRLVEPRHDGVPTDWENLFVRTGLNIKQCLICCTRHSVESCGSVMY